MDINMAKSVLARTHRTALAHGDRANGMLLESGPGLGKSDGTEQVAQELAQALGEPVGIVTFMLATISSVDVRGFMLPVKTTAGGLDTVFSLPPWMPVKGNTMVFTPDGKRYEPGEFEGDVPRVGILFLDEFAQAEDDVKKPAAELLYKGQVGTAKLPKGWRVVAAGNRTKDRSGVMRELMFIVNRRCRLSVDPNLPAWLSWANAQPPHQRPHYLTMSFAQKNPDIVFQDAVPAGTDPFCTPRTLCLMDKDLQALRTEDETARGIMPTDAIAREVCAGWIGAGAAAQYFTHCKFNEELPDMSEIEKDPATAKLPPNRDAQMVCGYMLAHNVTDKNAAKVIAYVKRLSTEMQVLTIRAITAQKDRAAQVVNEKGFSDWIIKNSKLLIASRS